MTKHQPGREDHLSEESFPDGFDLKEKPLQEGQLVLAMNRLFERIRRLEKAARLRGRMVRWTRVAAIIILLIGGYALFRRNEKKEALATAFGEMKTNRLPDGTEITANANTHIVWKNHWQDGEDREVWLNGEAFFHVSKTPRKSHFIVHTDHFDIIVTGTQFNAVNRSGQSSVLLQEGSVTVMGTSNYGVAGEYKMKPGDFVEYRDGSLRGKAINQDSLLAWKERKLELDNTSLRELALLITEHYGITVSLAGAGTAQRTISGILPNDNLDVLLKSLEATGEYNIIRENNTLIIKER